MKNNVILLLHSNSTIARQLSDQFKPYGITLKTRPIQKSQPWDDPGASTACVIMEVNSGVYRNLISRIDIKTLFGDTPLFLLTSNNVYQAARRDFSSKAVVIPETKNIEEIVETILRILALKRYSPGNSPEISFREGEKGLDLPLFLDFAKEEQLTGTIRLRNSSTEGAISLWRGEMQHIRVAKMRNHCALQHLMQLNNVQISFYPKIYHFADLETFATSRNSQYQPNPRDVMMDFFAICHRCWCDCKTLAVVNEVVSNAMDELREEQQIGYYLLYLPNKADVLQIVGEFYAANIRQIYELVANIHHQLFADTVPNKDAMAKMAGELQELKPFLETFAPFKQLFDKQMRIIDMPRSEVVI